MHLSCFLILLSSWSFSWTQLFLVSIACEVLFFFFKLKTCKALFISWLDYETSLQHLIFLESLLLLVFGHGLLFLLPWHHKWCSTELAGSLHYMNVHLTGPVGIQCFAFFYLLVFVAMQYINDALMITIFMFFLGNYSCIFFKWWEKPRKLISNYLLVQNHPFLVSSQMFSLFSCKHTTCVCFLFNASFALVVFGQKKSRLHQSKYQGTWSEGKIIY